MYPYGKTAPLVDLDSFADWIIHEDDDLLIVNKPGWLVCHPSKNGPLSSLVGVVREYTGVDKLHLIARLDRETSGLVLFAKRPSVARKFQMAIQARKVKKIYLAILEGILPAPVLVDQSVARRRGGPVFVKSEVSVDRTAQAALTYFEPLVQRCGYTLCRVIPETGRKHQIRVHAEWLGKPVVGDKIYGPDETLYIDFIESGWTERLETNLPMKRQALHCYSYIFGFTEGNVAFTASVQGDMMDFCRDNMNVDADEIQRLLQLANAKKV